MSETKASRTPNALHRGGSTTRGSRVMRQVRTDPACDKSTNTKPDCYPPQFDWAADSANAISSLCDVWLGLVLQWPTTDNDLNRLIELSQRLAFHANAMGLDASGLHRFCNRLSVMAPSQNKSRMTLAGAGTKRQFEAAVITVDSLLNMVLSKIAKSGASPSLSQDKTPAASRTLCGDDPRFPSSEWVTLKEAVALHGKPRSTLHRWIKTLPESDRGETEPVRQVVVRRAALEALVRRRSRRV